MDTDLDRFADNGNPIDPFPPDMLETLTAAVSHVETVRPISKAIRLTRTHKTIVHFATMIVIGVSLVIDGAKSADWLFLGLSVIVELN